MISDLIDSNKKELSFLGLGTELKESVKESLEESSGKFSDYPQKLF